MRETLSELLSLLELRGQTWCYVDLGASAGFTVPHGDAVYFYALLQGSARIAGITGGTIELQVGDMAVILSGEAHALRVAADSPASPLAFLRAEQNVDAPPAFALGEQGGVETRLLCGRLAVDWPRGVDRSALPPVVRLGSDSLGSSASLLRADAMQIAGIGAGATALLTRLASLILVVGLRNHPQAALLFKGSGKDPIAQALRLIAADPAAPWSVELLAQKVGMGRSSFAARFTAEVGRAPMEVITEQRMQRAADLLRTGDLKISEISERVGYGSEGAFSRRFTRHFGLSPSLVRRNAEKGKTEDATVSPWHLLLSAGPQRPDAAVRVPTRRPIRAAVGHTKFQG